MTKQLSWAGGIATLILGVLTFAAPSASARELIVDKCRWNTLCPGNQTCFETHCAKCEKDRCDITTCEECSPNNPCNEPQCLK